MLATKRRLLNPQKDRHKTLVRKLSLDNYLRCFCIQPPRVGNAAASRKKCQQFCYVPFCQLFSTSSLWHATTFTSWYAQTLHRTCLWSSFTPRGFFGNWSTWSSVSNFWKNKKPLTLLAFGLFCFLKRLHGQFLLPFLHELSTSLGLTDQVIVLQPRTYH